MRQLPWFGWRNPRPVFVFCQNDHRPSQRVGFSKSKRLKSRLCGFNEMPKTEVLTGSLVSSNNRTLIWDVADS